MPWILLCEAFPSLNHCAPIHKFAPLCPARSRTHLTSRVLKIFATKRNCFPRLGPFLKTTSALCIHRSGTGSGSTRLPSVSVFRPIFPYRNLILPLSLSLSLSVSRCSRLSFHPRAIDVARLSNECARSDNGDGACYVLVGRRKTGGGRTNERSNEREESCNDDEDDDEDEVTVTATSANTGAPDTNRSSPRHCFPTSSVNTHTHTHRYIYIYTHSHTASPNNALCQQ